MLACARCDSTTIVNDYDWINRRPEVKCLLCGSRVLWEMEEDSMAGSPNPNAIPTTKEMWERFAYAKTTHGLTNDQIAQGAKTSTAAISMLKNGGRLERDTIRKLAEAVGLTYEKLIGENGEGSGIAPSNPAPTVPEETHGPAAEEEVTTARVVVRAEWAEDILSVPFGDYPELLAKVRERAKEEFRSVQEQVLYFCHMALLWDIRNNG